MFGWSNSVGLPTVGSDPDKDRTPPPPPTPIDFPIYNPPNVSETPSEPCLRGLQNVLASIRRPQDITPHKFKDLNLKVEAGLPAAAIIACAPKTSTSTSTPASTNTPPLPWGEEEEASGGAFDRSRGEEKGGGDGNSTVFMENGNAYPPREKYEVLQAELLLDNDDAFREIERLPPREGRQRVRVTHARKFWTGMERLAQYWDASLDEYFERPKTPEPEPEPKPESESGPGPDSVAVAIEEGVDRMQTDEGSGGGGGGETPMDVDSDGSSHLPGDGASDSPAEQKKEMVRRYRGRRIACGQDMPDDIREETIRALAEMAAWPFGCQVALPIMPPRLAVGTLLFPVRQTFQATRSPKDRALARSGMLEGPVFVGQCRGETLFRTRNDAPGSGIGEICDVVREVGVMLLAAQERAREGSTEVRPGEGKWWTTTARWGGAPNDAVGDSGKVSSEEDKQQQQKQQSGNERKRSKYDHPFLSSRRSGGTRRMTNSEKWKLVQPGPSLWDRRLRYMQIGKPKDSPFDDIYMLSSINHHLAILHLRVHRRYLEVLTTGSSEFPPDSDATDQPWHVLKLRRTRWYNLFDSGDRVEVFKGIWTLFHHLLRRIDDGPVA